MHIKIIPLAKAKGIPSEGNLLRQGNGCLDVEVTQKKRGRGGGGLVTKIVHIPSASVVWEETVEAQTETAAGTPAPTKRKYTRRATPEGEERPKRKYTRRAKPESDAGDAGEAKPKRKYTRRAKPESDAGETKRKYTRRAKPDATAGEAKPKRKYTKRAKPESDAGEAKPKRKYTRRAKPDVAHDDIDETTQGRNAAAEWSGAGATSAPQVKPTKRAVPFAVADEDDEDYEGALQ